MKARQEFAACYSRGRKYYTKYFLLFFIPGGASRGHNETRLGLSVGRKVGNAVRRNRLKRLIRECFRLERTAFPPGSDIVVVAKQGFNPMKLNLADIREDLRAVLRRMHRDKPGADAKKPLALS